MISPEIGNRGTLTLKTSLRGDLDENSSKSRTNRRNPDGDTPYLRRRPRRCGRIFCQEAAILGRLDSRADSAPNPVRDFLIPRFGQEWNIALQQTRRSGQIAHDKACDVVALALLSVIPLGVCCSLFNPQP